MKRHTLQEFAKFAAGIVTADFFTLLWMSQQKHFVAISVLGSSIDSSVVLPAMIFDIALIIMLVHYGWHIGTLPRMKERNYLLVAGCLFTVVAVAHAIRIFTGADLVVMGWEAPLWLSWLGTLVTAYLAYASFHFTTRSR